MAKLQLFLIMIKHVSGYEFQVMVGLCPLGDVQLQTVWGGGGESGRPLGGQSQLLEKIIQLNSIQFLFIQVMNISNTASALMQQYDVRRNKTSNITEGTECNTKMQYSSMH